MDFPLNLEDLFDESELEERQLAAFLETYPYTKEALKENENLCRYFLSHQYPAHRLPYIPHKQIPAPSGYEQLFWFTTSDLWKFNLVISRFANICIYVNHDGLTMVLNKPNIVHFYNKLTDPSFAAAKAAMSSTSLASLISEECLFPGGLDSFEIVPFNSNLTENINCLSSDPNKLYGCGRAIPNIPIQTRVNCPFPNCGHTQTKVVLLEGHMKRFHEDEITFTERSALMTLLRLKFPDVPFQHTMAQRFINFTGGSSERSAFFAVKAPALEIAIRNEGLRKSKSFSVKEKFEQISYSNATPADISERLRRLEASSDLQYRGFVVLSGFNYKGGRTDDEYLRDQNVIEMLKRLIDLKTDGFTDFQRYDQLPSMNKFLKELLMLEHMFLLLYKSGHKSLFDNSMLKLPDLKLESLDQYCKVFSNIICLGLLVNSPSMLQISHDSDGETIKKGLRKLKSLFPMNDTTRNSFTELFSALKTAITFTLNAPALLKTLSTGPDGPDNIGVYNAALADLARTLKKHSNISRLIHDICQSELEQELDTPDNFTQQLRDSYADGESIHSSDNEDPDHDEHDDVGSDDGEEEDIQLLTNEQFYEDEETQVFEDLNDFDDGSGFSRCLSPMRPIPENSSHSRVKLSLLEDIVRDSLTQSAQHHDRQEAMVFQASQGLHYTEVQNLLVVGLLHQTISTSSKTLSKASGRLQKLVMLRSAIATHSLYEFTRNRSCNGVSLYIPGWLCGQYSQFHKRFYRESLTVGKETVGLTLKVIKKMADKSTKLTRAVNERSSFNPVTQCVSFTRLLDSGGKSMITVQEISESIETISTDIMVAMQDLLHLDEFHEVFEDGDPSTMLNREDASSAKLFFTMNQSRLMQLSKNVQLFTKNDFQTFFRQHEKVLAMVIVLLSIQNGGSILRLEEIRSLSFQHARSNLIGLFITRQFILEPLLVLVTTKLKSKAQTEAQKANMLFTDRFDIVAALFALQNVYRTVVVKYQVKFHKLSISQARAGLDNPNGIFVSGSSGSSTASINKKVLEYWCSCFGIHTKGSSFLELRQCLSQISLYANQNEDILAEYQELRDNLNHSTSMNMWYNHRADKPTGMDQNVINRSLQKFRNYRTFIRAAEPIREDMLLRENVLFSTPSSKHRPRSSPEPIPVICQESESSDNDSDCESFTGKLRPESSDEFTTPPRKRSSPYNQVSASYKVQPITPCSLKKEIEVIEICDTDSDDETFDFDSGFRSDVITTPTTSVLNSSPLMAKRRRLHDHY